MRLLEFQKLPENGPSRIEEGEKFLAGEKIIEQKVNAKEDSTVTFYVVTKVNRNKDGSIRSFEYSHYTTKLEK